MWRLCTVSDGNKRLRRESMCTAAIITTRLLLVQRLRWQHYRQAKWRERARLSRIRQCARASSSCSRWSCMLIRLRSGLRARWRHGGWDRRWRGHCALRWLKSRLDLRRRPEWRRWVCGAQYWRKGGSACNGDLRARFVRRSMRGAGGERGAAKLFEQRREGLGSNIGFSAKHAGAAGANECSRAGLYDSSARSARAKRSRRRDNRQFGALLAADGAAVAQSHWRRLVKRNDSAVRAQYVGAYKKGKVEPLNHKQRVMHCDTGEFNGRVDIAANRSACACNADDFRSGVRERLYHRRVEQLRVHSVSQH